MNPTLKILGVTSAVAWIMTGSSMAVVIYQDSFNRTGTLAGSSPGTTLGSYGGTAEATWITKSTFSMLGDGFVTAGATTQAYLPFSPQAGHIYTLSADMQSLGANWVALGFATVNFTTPSYGTNGWHEANSPVSWALMRTGSGSGKLTFFQGTGAAGGTDAGLNTLPGLNTLSIVLDTTNATTWTSTLWLNGVSTAITKNYSAAGWTANAIGIGDDGSDSLKADSFSLTTNIPEPSAALFGAFGMLALLRRRR